MSDSGIFLAVRCRSRFSNKALVIINKNSKLVGRQAIGEKEWLYMMPGKI